MAEKRRVPPPGYVAPTQPPIKPPIKPLELRRGVLKPYKPAPVPPVKAQAKQKYPRPQRPSQPAKLSARRAGGPQRD